MNKVKSEKPNLVILDVSMPQKSGIRFFKELRSDPELSELPVIMVTGVTGFGGDQDALKNFLDRRSHITPPNGFFSKPIDRDDFLKAVGEILS